MRRMLCAVLFVLACAAVCTAGEQVRLFKEFNAGMRYQEVAAQSGVAPESNPDAPEIRLARKDVEFAGGKWLQLFAFRDDYLTEVVLVADYHPDLYASVLETLGAGFSLLRIGSESGSYDSFSMLKTNPLEEVMAFIDNFEKESIRSGYLEVGYLDTDSFEAVIPEYDIERPFSQLAQLLPVNCRLSSLTVLTRRDIEEPYLRIMFSAPAYTAKLLQKD